MRSSERLERTLIAVADLLGKPAERREGASSPSTAAAAPESAGVVVGLRRSGGPGGSRGQLELGLTEDPGEAPERRVQSPPASGGFEPFGEPRDPRALRVERVLRALGGDVWESFEYALRTDLAVEGDAAAFAALALLCGPEAAADRSRPEVRSVRGAAFKVRREIHRLLGLLRFAPDPDGVLTARCEPDNEILDLLSPAFFRRFGGEPFRILDLRRGRVVESGRGSGREARGSESAGEPDPVELWKTYYKAVENPARLNPRLRLQFMPRRYWKHLPELDA
jgi:probable DNA metabolism protein